MNTIYGNILDIKQGIICHQVNAQYVMGAGLALQIARKWPVVKRTYQEQRPLLGIAQIVPVALGLWVFNLVGQKEYGRGAVQTDYTALTTSVRYAYKIAQQSNKHHSIYFPYMMGCGLAGGDWNVVHNILERHAPTAIIVRKSDVGK